MNDEPVAEAAGVVWAATWVPTPSPFTGFGTEGYAVAWVDVANAPRWQVLVEGPVPDVGATGSLHHRRMMLADSEREVVVFVPDTTGATT